jgi:hypothetical protein
MLAVRIPAPPLVFFICLGDIFLAFGFAFGAVGSPF